MPMIDPPGWLVPYLLPALALLLLAGGCSNQASSGESKQVTQAATAATRIIVPTLTLTAVAPTAVLPTATAKMPEASAREAVAPNMAAPDLLHGIGILGDSFYDEYQGTDARGGEYRAVTFNLVELLARNRSFHLGAWGDWGEPRRVGYQYNWARSGATSTTMIEMGQHSGLAEHIAAGNVTFVFIGIGSNDFSPYYGDFYERIYNGTMSDDELAQKVAGAIANVTLAVDTVRQAGAQGVAIALFMQWERDPTVPTLYPDAKRRQRVAQAIETVNEGPRVMAAERGVAVVNQIEYGTTMLLPNLDAEGYLNVGGERIDFLHHGDEPHHSRLADREHVGTVASGLTANYYLIETLNRSFGQAIPPLSEEEILREAGLRS
jgi:hypothetical protein